MDQWIEDLLDSERGRAVLSNVLLQSNAYKQSHPAVKAEWLCLSFLQLVLTRIVAKDVSGGS